MISINQLIFTVDLIPLIISYIHIKYYYIFIRLILTFPSPILIWNKNVVNRE